MKISYTSSNALAIPHPVPKSSLHYILALKLPSNSPTKILEALQDPAILALARHEVREFKGYVELELQRLIEQPSIQATSPGAGARLSGLAQHSGSRDRGNEILVGVHANPDIEGLYIHIITKDMRSKEVLHKTHYNSFASRFFISLDEFPITKGEIYIRASVLWSALRCWRCGRIFDNQIAEFKAHLEEEFTMWRLS